MTPVQIGLVQSSFAKVVPIADGAASLFYEDLFARAPHIRALFPPDMSEQRTKLVAMLATAVDNLDDWQKIVSALRDMGKRHVGYGTNPEHYEVVGAALLATLEKGLGADFTPETREAWTACYDAIASEMLRGAATA